MWNLAGTCTPWRSTTSLFLLIIFRVLLILLLFLQLWLLLLLFLLI